MSRIAANPKQKKAARLIRLANELLAMAHELEFGDDPDADEDESEPTSIFEHFGSASGDHPLWGNLARRHYADRRSRDAIFGTNELFAEPAWDMLLDLFIAAKERRQISVTSACVGAAVPSTTALRWIAVLEQHGLVRRHADSRDARRIFVELTALGYRRMVSYFSAVHRSWPSPPDEE